MAYGRQVELLTDNGIILGTESNNLSGKQKNLVIIEFKYGNITYRYPFSRKTGKLYAATLPFNIKLITKCPLEIEYMNGYNESKP